MTHLDPAGGTLLYSTFLGGTGQDGAQDIALDGAGHAYVTGDTASADTASADLPVTPGAFDTTFNGTISDAYVSKLAPDGSALVYSTYLGGTQPEFWPSIAVDGAGSAVIAGGTLSFDFPVTPGAYDTTHANFPVMQTDAFVTKLDPAGGALVFSTYLGADGWDDVTDIALDGPGRVYVAGMTSSPGFPTTPNAFDTTFSGVSYDLFISRLSASGAALHYSTFLGPGTGWNAGLTLDASGSIYVGGRTTSALFPTTPGAFDTELDPGGESDAFVSKLAPDIAPTDVRMSGFGGGGSAQTDWLAVAALAALVFLAPWLIRRRAAPIND